MREVVLSNPSVISFDDSFVGHLARSRDTGAGYGRAQRKRGGLALAEQLPQFKAERRSKLLPGDESARDEAFQPYEKYFSPHPEAYFQRDGNKLGRTGFSEVRANIIANRGREGR